jgi:hypothetical protein
MLGALIGAAIGLLGGLGFTTLAATSSFEGYSGYVVALWMLAGILIGMITGAVIGLRQAAR